MNDISDHKLLIRRCLDGGFEARREFQDRFGELIYNYPAACSRREAEEADDFYLYVLEKDRIFKRLENFRGERITLTDYLRFFVLKDLFFEWLRGRKRTTRNQEPYDDETLSQENEMEGHGDLPGADTDEALLALLRKEEFLILKCRHIVECELSPEDVRRLARISGRSLGETSLLLAEVEENLDEQRGAHQQIGDKLNSLYMITVGYQEKIGTLQRELERFDPQHHMQEVAKTRDAMAEWERKLAWRQRQRQKLLKKLAATTPTVSYKELSNLFNWPIGTICSRVARTRKAFQKAYLILKKEGTPA